MSSDEYLGCSDGGCIFGHRGGMHTNGGCHCVPSLSTFHTMTANERRQSRPHSARQAQAAVDSTENSNRRQAHPLAG